jgi:hypothetical protein
MSRDNQNFCLRLFVKGGALQEGSPLRNTKPMRLKRRKMSNLKQAILCGLP